MKSALAVLVGLIAAVSSALLLAWLLWRLWTREEEAPAVIEIEVPDSEPAGVPGEVTDREAGEMLVPSRGETLSLLEETDDLKAVEGIGPKISQLLQDAGIVTFAQLAATDAQDIQAILEAADLRLGRLADPSTWPAQAALAAEGDWQALADLQGELRGGRRA